MIRIVFEIKYKKKTSIFFLNFICFFSSKSIRQRSISPNDRQQQEGSLKFSIVNKRKPMFYFLDVKPKRIRREIQRSNTCPTLETRPAQRKSKRLRKSTVSPPPASASSDENSPTIKKELITSMKRPLPSTVSKEITNNPNQILVKTDKRFYWCTKCSTIYKNLISLYTESHYRQCVGEDQHFNVVDDPDFFQQDSVIQQLPDHNQSNETTNDANESSTHVHNPKKKESIFFTKTSDDARTYFINGKPVRMSTVNRPITVKDLRQQFQMTNSSEEYIYQQRPTTNRLSRSNESVVKNLPKPKSFDTFGISSDEDEQTSIKQEQIEIDSPSKSFSTRKTPTTNTCHRNSSLKHSNDEIDQPSTSSQSDSISIPDALKDYDYVCSKCNMPFVSQTSFDEHQHGQYETKIIFSS